MCGRFTLTSDAETLGRALQLQLPSAVLAPRYNIAPTQKVAVLLNFQPPRLEFYRWGLVPPGAKDPSIGSRLINARAETLRSKPAFRSAFAQRRCLILADGFFEWGQAGGGKARPRTPYYVQLVSGDPFAFAGLWESWRSPGGEELRTCTLVTCPANELISRFHTRMPVILEAESARRWLNLAASSSDLEALLLPLAASRMRALPVSPLVNNSRNDSPDCIRPASGLPDQEGRQNL